MHILALNTMPTWLTTPQPVVFKSVSLKGFGETVRGASTVWRHWRHVIVLSCFDVSTENGCNVVLCRTCFLIKARMPKIWEQSSCVLFNIDTSLRRTFFWISFGLTECWIGVWNCLYILKFGLKNFCVIAENKWQVYNFQHLCHPLNNYRLWRISTGTFIMIKTLSPA